MALRGDRHPAVRDLWSEKQTRARWKAGRRTVVGGIGPRTDSIPYAPAIAAGVWLSLVAAT